MRRAFLVVTAVVLFALPAVADPVSDDIEAARQAYARGELLKAANGLHAALDIINQRLAEALIPLMPPSPGGWQAYDAQADTMGIAGGGMTVMKGYEKDEASLNASIVIDPEAVTGVAELLSNPAAIGAQPGMSLVKVNGAPALMRWDAEDRSGEIMLVLGDSVLLQVIGNGIETSDLLVQMMKSWNIAAVRKQVGA